MDTLFDTIEAVVDGLRLILDHASKTEGQDRILPNVVFGLGIVVLVLALWLLTQGIGFLFDHCTHLFASLAAVVGNLTLATITLAYGNRGAKIWSGLAMTIVAGIAMALAVLVLVFHPNSSLAREISDDTKRVAAQLQTA